MTDLEILAISKAISAKDAKAARPGVTEGTYDVDLIVRVRGGIKAGADNPDAAKAGALPAKSLVTFLFSKMNAVTRAAAIRDYQDYMAADGEKTLGADIKDAVKACWEPLMEATRGFKAGTVTNTLTTEIVTADVLAPASPIILTT